MGFRELGISEKGLAALARAGFEAPTPIQAQAIPPALQGKDVIGCAATARTTRNTSPQTTAHSPAYAHW